MDTNLREPIDITISRREAVRHWFIWIFVWLFIVSGALQAGYPVFFSFWTQTPYVLGYAAVFYITLYKVAPYLHTSKIQLIG